MSMNRRVAPLAVELLEAYRNGKSVEELSNETGIPADRIEVRLRAAAVFLRRAKERSEWFEAPRRQSR